MLEHKQLVNPCIRTLCLFALLLGVGTSSLFADETKEVKLLVQLVWGTNQEKPKGEKLEPIRPILSKKLHGIFKWNDYYQVSKKTLLFPKHDGKKIRMSDKAEVIIRYNKEDDLIFVALIGETLLRSKIKHRLTPIMEKGDYLILAGDTKESYGDAWFLVISNPAHPNHREEETKP